MIIFLLDMRYFPANSNDKYGKDQIDRLVCGADTCFGEWIQAWSSAFSAATLPCCPVKGTGVEFTENSGESRLVPAVISREADGETIRKAIEVDRQSVKAAKTAWEASSGKTSPDETSRRFLSALAQDIDA